MTFARLAAPMAALAALSLAMPAAAQDRTPAPEGARAEILSPTDGETVASPVAFRFGLEGMEVAPAGTDAMNTGHHHLIVDIPQEGYDFSAQIPSDARHIHFGGGQTEVSVELPEGEHSVWLLLGDGNHVPHDPPVMSAPITIIVK